MTVTMHAKEVSDSVLLSFQQGQPNGLISRRYFILDYLGSAFHNDSLTENNTMGIDLIPLTYTVLRDRQTVHMSSCSAHVGMFKSPLKIFQIRKVLLGPLHSGPVLMLDGALETPVPSFSELQKCDEANAKPQNRAPFTPASCRAVGFSQFALHRMSSALAGAARVIGVVVPHSRLSLSRIAYRSDHSLRQAIKPHQEAEHVTAPRALSTQPPNSAKLPPIVPGYSTSVFTFREYSV